MKRRDLKHEARRALAQGVIDRFAQPFNDAAKTKLKQAIITAHSFHTLSQEDAITLIRQNGLSGA